MPGFPDVELALCEVLEAVAPTYTATEDELHPPVIVINRTGGGTDRLGVQDIAVVEVVCFGALRPDSVALNAAVRSTLSGARGIASAAGFIDKITETTAPIAFPDLNADVRRVVSTWTVTSRLQEIEIP